MKTTAFVSDAKPRRLTNSYRGSDHEAPVPSGRAVPHTRTHAPNVEARDRPSPQEEAARACRCIVDFKAIAIDPPWRVSRRRRPRQ